MIRILDVSLLVLFVLILDDHSTTAWVSTISVTTKTTTKLMLQHSISHRRTLQQPMILTNHNIVHQKLTKCFSTEPTNNNNNNNDDDNSGNVTIKRTTFDEAGRSLVEEEDTKRMEAMGDYDSIPDARQGSVEAMREAIRARTANLGIEKSKISAEYIQQKQKMAMSAGSARAAAEQVSGNTFAGLDLSQISDGSTSSSSTRRPPQSNSLWGDDDDDTPSMFYDAEERLTEQEREEVDPLIKKGIIEQGLNELQNAKWPDWASALREVFLMFAVIAFTGALIIGWDKVLRFTYTDILHFIPSDEEITNYASRFDGLDLPKGWTDNMNEADVQRLAEKVNDKLIQQSSSGGGLPSL